MGVSCVKRGSEVERESQGRRWLLVNLKKR